jgi:hypothetical protein
MAIWGEIGRALKKKFTGNYASPKYRRAGGGCHGKAVIVNGNDLFGLSPDCLVEMLAQVIPRDAAVWDLDGQVLRMRSGYGSMAYGCDDYAILFLHESFSLVPEGGSFTTARVVIHDDKGRVELQDIKE